MRRKQVGWGTKGRARPFVTMLQGLSLMLPLGGCFLASDLPEPGLDIPAAYERRPAQPRGGASGIAAARLVAQVPLARADRHHRAGARRQSRHRRGDRPHRAGRRAGARYRGAAAAADRFQQQRHPHASRPRPPARPPPAARSTGSTKIIHDDLKLTFNASYEIDFWGKNRAALQAAEESAVASRYDREVVGLTTVVAAANAYFQVLATQDRLKAARDDIVSATRVLDLIKQRVNAGTASALDTAQQESIVYNLRATIPPLQQTLKQNRTALAVLMARSPEQVHIRGGSLSAIAIPRVTPGLPSELLTQRPDIRKAEANLAAANANVSNARAQFLPSISLTGSGGYESAVLKILLRPESAIYSAAASLAQPIFHAGQLLGNLDLQKARQDELLQDYRKAVISAFGDVENALDAVHQTSLRVTLQAQVVKSSRQAFNISEERLREGTIDLVTVLQTQQTLYQAQDTLFQAQLARLQAIVSLYQALGGGWLPKPPPVEASNAR